MEFTQQQIDNFKKVLNKPITDKRSCEGLMCHDCYLNEWSESETICEPKFKKEIKQFKEDLTESLEQWNTLNSK